MGGSAFSSGLDPLFTPRMPPDVYRYVKGMLHARLRELFVCVASPIEGPAKTDFGDVDILVAMEKEPADEQSLLASVQRSLGSERAIIPKGPASANMAIAWPHHLLSPGANPRCHIQVDVHICRSLDEMSWILFKHAHSDMWGILGSIIRPYGLTVDEGAMHIRIPEIEKLNRNRAKIHLTSDAVETLHFLGLPVDIFWEQPFASAEDLFEYAARCRWFWVPPETSNGDGDEDAGVASYPGGEEGRKRLKANDRRWMRTRSLFRRFFDEFVPGCRAAGRFSRPRDGDLTTKQLRDLVRRDAFERFPAARSEYESTLASWCQEQEAGQVWNSCIQGNVPVDLEPSYRGAVCSALKKIILRGDESFGVVPAAPLQTTQGFWRLDQVSEFVREHWETVGAIAWNLQQERYRAHLAKKRLRGEAEEVRTAVEKERNK